MPTIQIPARPGSSDALFDVWTPDNAIQIDAVVAACALVAQADGWVTVEERQAMVRRMRTSPLVTVFNLDEILSAFTVLNQRFDHDLEDGEASAEAAIAALENQPKFARLLVETACSVANADGGFDPAEWQAIMRICDLLSLDPADFDVTPTAQASP